MRMMTISSLLACVACLAPGCASRLPAHEWQGSDAALATLGARSRSIRSVRATGTLVLTSKDNQHVTLDAAIVASNEPARPTTAQPPTEAQAPSALRLRLRTWKFGQAVFDLTIRPDGSWLAAGGQGEGSGSSDRLRALKPRDIAQAWNLFFGDFFTDAKITIDTPALFTVVRNQDYTVISSDIDKHTLTATEYRIADAQGRVHEKLTLARYAMIGDTPWPMMIIARGDEGRIDIRFDEVEINPQLEDAVFTPPKRAVKQP